ncbi:MAG: hypothetical protein QG575_865 [Euryarchaeota archaeon]|nr:hypothetical protein [Euryarchaeota archaeon]
MIVIKRIISLPHVLAAAIALAVLFAAAVQAEETDMKRFQSTTMIFFCESD